MLHAGQGEGMAMRYFSPARNTAVRGAEVHSLPLNFPLKKAGYGLQAHGGFETEPLNLLFAFGDGTSQL